MGFGLQNLLSPLREAFLNIQDVNQSQLPTYFLNSQVWSRPTGKVNGSIFQLKTYVCSFCSGLPCVSCIIMACLISLSLFSSLKMRIIVPIESTLTVFAIVQGSVRQCGSTMHTVKCQIRHLFLAKERLIEWKSQSAIICAHHCWEAAPHNDTMLLLF